jgi:hypothetical protein
MTDNEANHEIAIDTAEQMRQMQQLIAQLEEVVRELRKEVDRLTGIWNFGQRMSDDSGMKIIKKAGDDKDE